MAEPTPLPTPSRRDRFRSSVSQLAERSTASDLVRWLLVPASLAIVGGFVLMVLGWYGASHTSREIEQIPYLISGGLIGLGLVVVGGLLLSATFLVAVVRKLASESQPRPDAQPQPTRRRSRAS
jgi:hypothetical protein